MAENPTSSSLSTPRRGSAAFVFILVMVALDMVAFGIIAPVLPDLIRQFEGGDFARASDLTGRGDSLYCALGDRGAGDSIADVRVG